MTTFIKLGKQAEIGGTHITKHAVSAAPIIAADTDHNRLF